MPFGYELKMSLDEKYFENIHPNRFFHFIQIDGFG